MNLEGIMARRGSSVAAILMIAGVASLAVSAAQAQTNASGPMFSTPASRSTTGAPILNTPPAAPNGGIINSAGGASAGAPPAKPAAQADIPAREPAPTETVAAAQRFDTWELQCETIAAASRVCQISSRVTSPDGSQVILVMSLANDASAKVTRMQMAVPLGIALAEKVDISVAPNYEASLSVSRCTPQGCLVEGSVEPALMTALREGQQAIISVATPEKQRIPIALALKGFSAAFEALEASEKAIR